MKKPNTLFALFLVFTFTSFVPSLNAQPILDTEGNLLENPGEYYILPVTSESGRGLDLVSTGNEHCPQTIALATRDHKLPTIFSSMLRIPVIFQGHPISIELGNFAIITKCIPASPLWTVVKGLPEGLAVKIDGFENQVPGRFTIREASSTNSHYKILFCPYEYPSCTNLAVYDDGEGTKRLVVSNETDPLVVQFEKVKFPLPHKTHLRSVTDN